MRADHSDLSQVSAAKRELSDSELENVAAGGTAKALQVNAYRVDPYKTFKFRVS